MEGGWLVVHSLPKSCPRRTALLSATSTGLDSLLYARLTATDCEIAHANPVRLLTDTRMRGV